MVRPPRSHDTLAAQAAIDRARGHLGSPSMPPEDFNPDSEVTKTGQPIPVMQFPEREQGTGAPIIGHVTVLARLFKSDAARLVFLLAAIAAFVFLVWAGAISINLGK